MMTGKNNFSSFKYLLIVSNIVVVLSTIHFQNIYISFFYFSSLILSFFFVKHGIRIIERKNLFQNIRVEGPLNHLKKKNTPTMGGIIIIPIFLLILLITNQLGPELKILLFFTFSGFFIIGFYDDFLSIKNKINLGLNVKQKLFLQISLAIIFCIVAWKNNYLNSNIGIPFNYDIDIKEFALPLAILTIVSLSNSVNLTDGLDGLAAGCSSIVFCGLGIEILLNNNSNLMAFSLLSFSMSGLCLGFLAFNKFPAKIFMGDTGSLCIGSIIGIICVLTNSYIITLIFSGVFLVEALSVIIQVTYFKSTKLFFQEGKRLLLMSPLHHHFELKGNHESIIVENFWKTNIILVILGIVLKIGIK